MDIMSIKKDREPFFQTVLYFSIMCYSAKAYLSEIDM